MPEMNQKQNYWKMATKRKNFERCFQSRKAKRFSVIKSEETVHSVYSTAVEVQLFLG